MLSPEHRLRPSALFSNAMKRGRKKGSRTVVVSLWVPEPEDYGKGGVPLAFHGGPRTGLIVSKAVGNAVVRHDVSRKLRAVLDAIVKESAQQDAPLLPVPSFIVVRALPASAVAPTEELAKDVRQCIKRLTR